MPSSSSTSTLDSLVEVNINCPCKLETIPRCTVPLLRDEDMTGPPTRVERGIKGKLWSIKPKSPYTQGKAMLAWALTLRYFCGRNTVAFVLCGASPVRNRPTPEVDFDTYLSKKVVEVVIHESSVLVGDLYEMIEDALDERAVHTCRVLPGGDLRRWMTVVSFLETTTPQTEEPNPFEPKADVEADKTAVGEFCWYAPDGIDPIQKKAVVSTFRSLFRQIDCDDCLSVAHVDPYVGDWDQYEIFMSRVKDEPAAVRKTIIDMVLPQAAANPGRPAVTSTEAAMSYADLLCSAKKIACKLIDMGIGPGSIVPIFATKQIWVPSAMLAVVQAGAAFLPLDASHPRERVYRSLSQVNVKMIVRSSDAPVIDMPGVEQLTLSELAISTLPELSKHLPEIDPESVAYVICTSGSTGTPKAATVTHANIATSATHHGEAVCMDDTTRMLQFASYAFDVSIFEIITTLIHGGCVCVPSEEERMSSLAEVTTKMQCTHAFFTPTVVSLLKPEELPTLKHLVVGGEAMTRPILECWADKLNLWQVWGPAETAVIATVRLCERHDDPQLLGQFAGCTALLINPDDGLHIVPDGTVGEILLKGPIVGKGYLNDGQKTKEAFMTPKAWYRLIGIDEDTDHKGRRMYKTGDLGYFDDKGMLHFVGRKDHQLKINGIRIETGEIEATLQEALPLAERVVVEFAQLEGNSDRKTLVAFVVMKDKDDKPLGQQALMQYVGDRQTIIYSKLLRAVRPAIYFLLSSMPSTANGKADRQALRDLLADAESLEPARAS